MDKAAEEIAGEAASKYKGIQARLLLLPDGHLY